MHYMINILNLTQILKIINEILYVFYSNPFCSMILIMVFYYLMWSTLTEIPRVSLSTGNNNLWGYEYSLVRTDFTIEPYKPISFIYIQGSSQLLNQLSDA